MLDFSLITKIGCHYVNFLLMPQPLLLSLFVSHKLLLFEFVIYLFLLPHSLIVFDAPVCVSIYTSPAVLVAIPADFI